jgi:hypothetical protein
MASGGWAPMEHVPQVAETAGVRPTYELRPLSLGEVLDRTFGVYRGHFWLFVGIASLSGAVQLVANSILLLVYHALRIKVQPGFGFANLERQIGSWIALVAFFLAAAVTQAATVWAVSEVYLGRTTTIGDSIRAVIGRWLRYVGIAFWQGWSALWLPLVLVTPAVFILIRNARTNSGGAYGSALAGVLIFLGLAGGMTYGVIAFLRNSLGVQTAVVEGQQLRAAMRRSKVLTRGAKGRIFVVFLIAWCLAMVGGMLEMPLALFVGFRALRGEEHLLAQGGLLLINFVTHTLVTPVVLIGLSLMYFDQRVRQEALDLVLMLGGTVDGSNASGEFLRPAAARESRPADDAAAL